MGVCMLFWLFALLLFFFIWLFAFILFLIGHDFCFNKLCGIFFFFIDCLFIFLIEHNFFNKGIWVNVYQLHFPSSHFSYQSNKWVFHFSTFPSFHPNTYEIIVKINHLCKIKEERRKSRHMKFIWFGNMPTSINGDRESSTIKLRDYNSSIITLSQDLNPKYTIDSYTQRASNCIYTRPCRYLFLYTIMQLHHIIYIYIYIK